MQAIGHFVLNHNPNVRVAYVTSETFTNDLINSIRDDKTLDFRNRYRNVEVLLVDDIQFLAGKERTQKNSFTHSTHYMRPTSNWSFPAIGPRKISRPWKKDCVRGSSGGLRTFSLLIWRRASLFCARKPNWRVSVPDDVMLYIASRIENIRELEGL